MCWWKVGGKADVPYGGRATPVTHTHTHRIRLTHVSASKDLPTCQSVARKHLSTQLCKQEVTVASQASRTLRMQHLQQTRLFINVNSLFGFSLETSRCLLISVECCTCSVQISKRQSPLFSVFS